MNENAEYGVAAHWRYKEADRHHDEKFVQRLNYLRHLMEFGPANHEDPEEFVNSMKSEVFQDRVYVYTPQGDIVDLPAGSTPIDFAYHIHTEIGERCRGAKIHGKLVNLNYQLKTGDQVEIIAAKRGGPSMDWLNPDLGYARTTRARTKIRQWFRKLNRDRHIALGREVIEREMKRMGVLDTMSFEQVSTLFEFSKVDDFMAAVGAGDINANTIANRVLDEERAQKRFKDANSLIRKPRAIASTSSSNINILGTGGLLVNFAKCCNPTPGDPITGYITRGRGVTIHRADCANILSLNDPERLIDVSWGGSDEEQHYRVPVEIVAYDREGLIRDISTVIADERINIAEVRVSTRQEIATFHITMEISHSQQLSRILSKITQIKSVVEAYRSHSN
jgi:GTP pyrophosphokinase